VVSYNRDLCVKYDAYINVERAVVRSVVKYLYKYVHIGHDPATIILKSGIGHDDSEQSHNDKQRNEPRNDRQKNEIQEYLDCCYVSAVESCWRIFEFN